MTSGVGTGEQIIFYGQMLKCSPAFHNLDQTHFHHCRRIHLVNAFTFKFDGAFGDLTPFGLDQIGNRFEGGGFSGAIGPQQGNNSATGYFQRYPLEDQDDMFIDNFDIIDLQ